MQCSLIRDTPIQMRSRLVGLVKQSFMGIVPYPTLTFGLGMASGNNVRTHSIQYKLVSLPYGWSFAVGSARMYMFPNSVRSCTCWNRILHLCLSGRGIILIVHHNRFIRSVTGLRRFCCGYVKSFVVIRRKLHGTSSRLPP